MNPKNTISNDGNIHIPFEKRTGPESIVYFTRNLSSEGLQKIYEKVKENIYGKIGIKVHTGEANGPNIIPREWVKNLIEKEIPKGTIVETNVYYEGTRYTTEQHRKTLEINGWTFAPVDILDEFGTADLPVKNGKWFDHMTVGKSLLDYESLVVLTHFKGHVRGGFGGANKNIGIGCADGRIGKKMMHTSPNQPNKFDIAKEEFMERVTESTKSIVDYFGNKITYINVMRNMSISCDCEGIKAQPVVTPNVGILASRDICAIDNACVDLILAMNEKDNHDFVERMSSRHSYRQLTYMKEIGLGNDKYKLIDIDNFDKEISLKDAVSHVVPFKNE